MLLKTKSFKKGILNKKLINFRLKLGKHFLNLLEFIFKSETQVPQRTA